MKPFTLRDFVRESNRIEGIFYSGRPKSAFLAHVEFEKLHPFMDGNGRTGRALWLWHMGGIKRAPLGFLHHFYYQTLDAAQNAGTKFGDSVRADATEGK